MTRENLSSNLNTTNSSRKKQMERKYIFGKAKKLGLFLASIAISTVIGFYITKQFLEEERYYDSSVKCYSDLDLSNLKPDSSKRTEEGGLIITYSKIPQHTITLDVENTGNREYTFAAIRIYKRFKGNSLRRHLKTSIGTPGILYLPSTTKCQIIEWEPSIAALGCDLIEPHRKLAIELSDSTLDPKSEFLEIVVQDGDIILREECNPFQSNNRSN